MFPLFPPAVSVAVVPEMWSASHQLTRPDGTGAHVCPVARNATLKVSNSAAHTGTFALVGGFMCRDYPIPDAVSSLPFPISFPVSPSPHPHRTSVGGS